MADQATRPDWATWLMRLAFVTAQRGSCLRKKVGAIIVRDRDKAVISGGYNGAPRGMPDCLEVGCEMRVIGEKESCVRTIHAESNALDRAGPLNEPHTIYCTVIPCRDCALRIIQNGWIHKVVYAEWYESRNSKDTEMLFANRDPAFINLMTKRIGAPEETGWIPTPRIELVKLEGPFDQGLDAARSIAWKLFAANHLTRNGLVTRESLTELIEQLCDTLGVSTEPPRP